GESRPRRRLKCGPLESSAPSRCDRPRTDGEGEMFDVLKRHEIQVLRRAGLKQTQVAELTGVSERSVRRVEEQPAITSVEEPERRVGRPAKAEQFRRFLVAELAKDPH